MIKARNTSLDILKGVGALLVIWVHEQFPGIFGRLVNQIACFAVPTFFMVSGYFSRNSTREKLVVSICHILRLIAIAYGLNLLRIIVFDGAAAAVDALVNAFSPKTLILWIVLNITPISGVSWFLFALLYCYILHWLFHKQVQDRRIFILILLAFLGGLTVRLLLPMVGIDGLGINNAWFRGIPFYLLGQWFRENHAQIVEKPTYQFCVTMLVGLVMSILCVTLADWVGYISSIFFTAGAFGLCIKYPNGRSGLLSRIGGTYAFFVYIGHALMIHIFNAILPVGDSLLLAWTRPVLLAAATVGCAAVWYDLIRRQKA